MPLLNSGVVTANWKPRVRRDGNDFTATYAGYQDVNGFIRYDNAHVRNTLHVDICYREQHHKHAEPIDLGIIKMINRRRESLQSLMLMLEKNVEWRIPVWFYMPWTMWWEDYRDLPDKLKTRKPDGIPISFICEAVMANLAFNPTYSEPGTRRMAKFSLETIEDATNRFIYDLSKTGQYELEAIVFGETIIVPFPMYAPPGSKIEASAGLGGLIDG
jgi:hypothetical protein